MDWGFIFERSFSAMIGPEVVVYAIAAVGLNVHFGYTGLMNFGQVGFMAAGAYGVGVTVYWLEWNFWIGILFSFVYVAVLALLLGLPTLRLRADYLSLVTIAASETIRLLARSRVMKPYTGGVEGVNQFAGPFYDLSPFELGKFYSFGPFKYLGRDVWVLVVGWTLLILITLMVRQLMRSPWGRTLRAIREDEDAARALGKNAYFFKMQSLLLGGMIGGVAGVIQVIQKASVQADTFNPVIVDFYRAVGYLPWAIDNYLALLGWSYDDKTEFFSRAELVEKFSLGRINSSPASFDPKKLWAVQDHYMTSLSTEEKLGLMLPYLQKAGLVADPPTAEQGRIVRRVIEASGDRLKVAGDILAYADFFLVDEPEMDPEAVAKRLATPAATMGTSSGMGSPRPVSVRNRMIPR